MHFNFCAQNQRRIREGPPVCSYVDGRTVQGTAKASRPVRPCLAGGGTGRFLKPMPLWGSCLSKSAGTGALRRKMSSTRRHKLRSLASPRWGQARPLRCASSPHKAEGRLCGGPLGHKLRSLASPVGGKLDRFAVPPLPTKPKGGFAGARWGTSCAHSRSPVGGKLDRSAVPPLPTKPKGGFAGARWDISCGQSRSPLNDSITQGFGKVQLFLSQGNLENVKG